MDHDAIAEIGFDELGRLYVMPLTVTFPYVYREGMEVGWDEVGHYLHAPPPPRSNVAPTTWWLRQILDAARRQDCDLRIAPETRWRNIPPQWVEEINLVLRGRHT